MTGPRLAKIRVAVVFGGRSSEHSISCLSAANILEALDRDKYEVVAIGITRKGSWHHVSDNADDWRRDGVTLPSVVGEGPRAVLAPGVDGDHIVDHGHEVAGLISADVVFPVLHGPFGEDGTIQGALEMAAMPYVGSGVLASAATMDKQVTKVLLAGAGLPVGGYVAVSDNEWFCQRDEVLARVRELRFPVFVKPARAGSSMGITKVHEPSAVLAAIEAARELDRKIIIEESIEGAREIECGVLASRGHLPPRASNCAEIIVGGDHEFYDFAAKYLDDSARLSVPADIPQQLHQELGALAVTAFDALGCDGLARVDFFLAPDGAIYINEVNTMPGFTAISMFPRMWQSSGIEYPALVDELICLALDRVRS
ncbi:MAG: D-alanine--D-alanine ligase family protein [Actinomycetes bacterium]